MCFAPFWRFRFWQNCFFGWDFFEHVLNCILAPLGAQTQAAIVGGPRGWSGSKFRCVLTSLGELKCTIAAEEFGRAHWLVFLFGALQCEFVLLANVIFALRNLLLANVICVFALWICISGNCYYLVSHCRLVFRANVIFFFALRICISGKCYFPFCPAKLKFYFLFCTAGLWFWQMLFSVLRWEFVFLAKVIFCFALQICVPGKCYFVFGPVRFALLANVVFLFWAVNLYFW